MFRAFKFKLKIIQFILIDVLTHFVKLDFNQNFTSYRIDYVDSDFLMKKQQCIRVNSIVLLRTIIY